MVLRSAAAVMAAIDFILAAGQASAQYYRPYPPPPAADDDVVPGPYERPGRWARPNPYDMVRPPADIPSGRSPYGRPLPPDAVFDDEDGPPPQGYPPRGAYNAPPPSYNPPASPPPVISGPPASAPPQQYGAVPNGQNGLRPPGSVGPQQDPVVTGALPPEYQPEQNATELPPQFRRQLVDYRTPEPAGTIVIDTQNTFLYLVLGDGKAMRYGIGVGREGFTWSGAERISRMAEWPDWHPPAEMIARQPYLPRFMAGGPGNPLGARALYLGNTLYRIHGTNQPSTIGTFVSSGCIRLINEDIEDLYRRVQKGTRVVVLPGRASPPVAGPGPGPRAAVQ